MTFDLYDIRKVTQWQRDVFQVYKRIVEDPELEERLTNQECRLCYYSSNVGCTKGCTVQCRMCDTDIRCRNTNTPTLCYDCAKANRLCKHCGADIELRQRRKL